MARTHSRFPSRNFAAAIARAGRSGDNGSKLRRERATMVAYKHRYSPSRQTPWTAAATVARDGVDVLLATRRLAPRCLHARAAAVATGVAEEDVALECTSNCFSCLANRMVRRCMEDRVRRRAEREREAKAAKKLKGDRLDDRDLMGDDDDEDDNDEDEDDVSDSKSRIYDPSIDGVVKRIRRSRGEVLPQDRWLCRHREHVGGPSKSLSDGRRVHGKRWVETRSPVCRRGRMCPGCKEQDTRPSRPSGRVRRALAEAEAEAQVETETESEAWPETETAPETEPEPESETEEIEAPRPLGEMTQSDQEQEQERARERHERIAAWITTVPAGSGDEIDQQRRIAAAGQANERRRAGLVRRLAARGAMSDAALAAERRRARMMQTIIAMGALHEVGLVSERRRTRDMAGRVAEADAVARWYST